ncbi:MAG TPA: response regulator [Stellaceae bacterium]|nr:response regulator [Stellaceae bacterium]
MDHSKLAILVLEDEDQVRDLISEVLAEAGFDVATAATGWEAVALVEEKKFDLIVADIRLPGGLDGLQVAQHLRSRQPGLKCLFVSGQRDPVICDPALDDFIAKPFRPHELLGCVWKVLRGNEPYPRIPVAPIA